ncbi:TetR/AcrR family transcriptional regulator [Paracoccus albus]|uniref:TetR/AcrR family transcriptional regulator n=1 Tax=Paracoccus albus TaxID=3017784 RepID=UPI0022F10203|nr:TetR/AcrR family transcriptional regulator [Paracoccus albus]WBU59927.1 TetR family transcriptional regulator [Paracoccus albus]
MTKQSFIEQTQSDDLSPREAIMKAAEKVFGSVGFDGATTREIAREAGVNLALIHYYFGNKRTLFEATVKRRADYLNDQRRALLAQLPDRPPLEQIFESLLRPAVEIRLLPDGQYFARLVADVASRTDEQSRALTSAAFDPIAREFSDRIAAVYPLAGHAKAVRAYMFAISVSISLMANTGREASLAGAGPMAEDFELDAVISDAVAFVTAGAHAILTKTAGQTVKI